MGISELTTLNYGDVQDALEAGVLPVLLDLVRQKTQQPYRTFLGRDAIKYLKLYLSTRRHLTKDSPLFTMLGSETRITKGALERRFRDLAEQASFVKTHQLDGYNPTRPHSLRSAFRSRLTWKMDETLIEYFMGHAIGDEKRAYLNLPQDELSELYSNHEHLLAIERMSKDEQIQEAQESTQLVQRIQALEDRIGPLEQLAHDANALINYLTKTKVLPPSWVAKSESKK